MTAAAGSNSDQLAKCRQRPGRATTSAVAWVRCSWTDRRFESAALHRIRLGTCWFIPVPDFYWEINEWLKGWAKRWVLLWSVIFSCEIHRNLIFRWRKPIFVTAPTYKPWKPVDSRTKSVLREWQHFYIKRACCGRQRLLTHQSSADVLRQQLNHWFCSQKPRLTSGIVFGSDGRMTGWGLNLDFYLNSATWPTNLYGFISSATTE